MQARVTAATLKRLDKLIAPLRVIETQALYRLAMINGIESLTPENRDRLTRAQRTVLSWPRLLSIEEWEKSTTASQRKLVEQARD